MRLYASQLKIGGKVIDLDTQRPIRKVIWVDEEKGECEAYQVGADGKLILTYDTDGAAAWQTLFLKGRFKFIPSPTKASVTPKLGAPYCQLCRSPLTLMGDELCPRCKAKDRGKPLPKAERINPLEINRRCERCSADATWMVTDEVEVTPQAVAHKRNQLVLGIGNGTFMFERAASVGVRYYCPRHWQPPRLVDSKGEVIADVGTELSPDTIKQLKVYTGEAS